MDAAENDAHCTSPSFREEGWAEAPHRGAGARRHRVLIFRNDLYLDTRVVRFRQFLARLVGRTPAKSWVSKFLKHHSMSSRIVQPTAPELVNRRAYRQGVEFLRALQASGKQPSQVLFADKISFSIPHRTVRMIAPKGAGTPHHPLRSGGPPIYVYSSSVGDDSMGPFYARH